MDWYEEVVLNAIDMAIEVVEMDNTAKFEECFPYFENRQFTDETGRTYVVRPTVELVEG